MKSVAALFYGGSAAGRRVRALPVAGFCLVLAGQLIFIASGGDRPFPYTPVQILAAGGTAVLIFGAATATPAGLTIGFAVNGVARVAQVALGLSRLPFVLNAALAAGWIWASVASGRGRSPAAALWLLGFAHVASMFWALGRFEASIALALVAAGMLLAAPSVVQEK